MEFRQLGNSGLRVPVLCFGTGTFGGTDEFFSKWGSTQVEEARELVDLCMDAGVNFFDTADVYSEGNSEKILGEAIAHLPRESVLLSTKCTFPFGPGPNDSGSSRYHITQQLHGSLKRLQTDYIDVYHMHAFDALTPMEETLNTLDTFVREGKIRYIACSNFSGWHLQRSLDISEKYGWARYAAHQAYYSLVGRDYEWELMPLGVKEGVSCLVWSPLGWGRLTGKVRRGQPAPSGSRFSEGKDKGPVVEDEFVFDVVEVLDQVAGETGHSVPEVALNWLLRKPTISSLVIGARNADQLKVNLQAASFTLTREQVERLDKVSERPKAYPYWHQEGFHRNPPPPSYR